MRLVIDLIVGINAAAGIIGLLLRRSLRQRRLSHADYQERLRAENRELDDERKRIGG